MTRGAWTGILVAPLLALGAQSIAYALVERSCARQDLTTMHLVHFAFLVLTLIAFAVSLAQWRRFDAHQREDAGDVATTASTLGAIGTLVAALSALVIVAMWAPQWILSPCHG